MLRKAVGLIVVGAVFACRPANRTDPAAVRHVIDSLNTKIEGWYAAGQADSIAAVFAQDAIQMPPNMAPVVGRDSVRGFWTNSLRTGKWDFDLGADEVLVSDSLAVERGHYASQSRCWATGTYPCSRIGAITL